MFIMFMMCGLFVFLEDTGDLSVLSLERVCRGLFRLTHASSIHQQTSGKTRTQQLSVKHFDLHVVIMTMMGIEEDVFNLETTFNSFVMKLNLDVLS